MILTPSCSNCWFGRTIGGEWDRKCRRYPITKFRPLDEACGEWNQVDLPPAGMIYNVNTAKPRLGIQHGARNALNRG